MVAEINQRLSESSPIYLFSYNPETKAIRYSRPFFADEARDLTADVNRVIDTDYQGIRGLRQGLSAHEQTGELYNMNPLKGILANRVLSRNTNGKHRMHTLREMVSDDRNGLLRRDILVDAGMAVYSGKDPDSEIAGILARGLETRGYKLPAFLSFNSLDLVLGGTRYGVTPVFVPNGEIISGQEAIDFSKENKFILGNLGAHRLYRGGDGYWYGDWGDDLDIFNEGCRVGRLVAEGNAQKIGEEALRFNDLHYSGLIEGQNDKAADLMKQVANLEKSISALNEQRGAEVAAISKSLEAYK